MFNNEQAKEKKKNGADNKDDSDDDDIDLVTVEELKVLVGRGQELPVNPAVDEILNELEQMLKVSQSWEEKASICLQAKYVIARWCSMCNKLTECVNVFLACDVTSGQLFA